MRVILAGCVILLISSWTFKPDGKHLFILSGQSNMARLSPEESFTPAVESEFGKENVIVVKYALGAQPIRRWFKGWKSPGGDPSEVKADLYDSLMNRVLQSIEGETISTVTFVWMQGENDAKGVGAVYGKSLLGLYKQICDDLNFKDVNLVIGRLSDYGLQSKKYPDWNVIREVQVKLGESNPRFGWIDTDDLNDGLNSKGQQIKDDLHMSVEGYKVMGDRFARKAIQLIEKNESLAQGTKVEKRMPEKWTFKPGGKHLFILSGQSNMAGLNPEESFTPAVESEFGKENVIVVKYALGGKPIRRWFKGWKSPGGDPPEEKADLYDSMMKRVLQSIDGKAISTVTFVWMQGEADARGVGAVYEKSLLGLYKQICDDLNFKDVDLVIGRLSDHGLQSKKYPDWNVIREVQVKLGESNPRFGWIDTDDLNDGLNNKGQQIKDDLHMSVEGYKVMGDRFARKAIQLIEKNNRKE